MLNEIKAAVLFLVNLIEKSEKFSPDQLECFKQHLVELLTERFKNHWFPDKPFKGQGYRCIRVNGHNRRDATLESAANAAGVKYEDLALPVELTLWVDPNEVCCRFGESKGSYCTLASFDDKENTVPIFQAEHNENIENENKPAHMGSIKIQVSIDTLKDWIYNIYARCKYESKFNRVNERIFINVYSEKLIVSEIFSFINL